MITGINESEVLKKHISWDCKCRMDGRKCNGGITIDVNVSVKSAMHVKKIILESFYMQFWKWETFRKYYWQLSNYMLCAIKLDSHTTKKQILMKNQPVKPKISIFYLRFYQLL